MKIHEARQQAQDPKSTTGREESHFLRGICYTPIVYLWQFHISTPFSDHSVLGWLIYLACFSTDWSIDRWVFQLCLSAGRASKAC